MGHQHGTQVFPPFLMVGTYPQTMARNISPLGNFPKKGRFWKSGMIGVHESTLGIFLWGFLTKIHCHLGSNFLWKGKQDNLREILRLRNLPKGYHKRDPNGKKPTDGFHQKVTMDVRQFFFPHFTNQKVTTGKSYIGSHESSKKLGMKRLRYDFDALVSFAPVSNPQPSNPPRRKKSGCAQYATFGAVPKTLPHETRGRDGLQQKSEGAAHDEWCRHSHDFHGHSQHGSRGWRKREGCGCFFFFRQCLTLLK